LRIVLIVPDKKAHLIHFLDFAFILSYLSPKVFLEKRKFAVQSQRKA